MNDEGLFQHLETQLSELTVLTAYVDDPFERGYNAARAQASIFTLYNLVKDRNRTTKEAHKAPPMNFTDKPMSS